MDEKIAKSTLMKAISCLEREDIWVGEDPKKILPERSIVGRLQCKLEHEILKFRNNNKPEYTIRVDIELEKNIGSNGLVERKYPDIILHRSQSDTNAENQIFACEVKIFPSCKKIELWEDFDTLYKYLTLKKEGENIGFHQVFMILVGCNKRDFIKYLDKKFRINRFNNIEKIKEYLSSIKKVISQKDLKERFNVIFIPKNFKSSNPETDLISNLGEIVFECEKFDSQLKTLEQ